MKNNILLELPPHTLSTSDLMSAKELSESKAIFNQMYFDRVATLDFDSKTKTYRYTSVINGMTDDKVGSPSYAIISKTENGLELTSAYWTFGNTNYVISTFNEKTGRFQHKIKLHEVIDLKSLPYKEDAKSFFSRESSRFTFLPLNSTESFMVESVDDKIQILDEENYKISKANIKHDFGDILELWMINSPNGNRGAFIPRLLFEPPQKWWKTKE